MFVLGTKRDEKGTDAFSCVQDVVKELQFHIAELTRSEKFARVRNSIAALGGTIGTVSAAVAIAAKPENPVWWAAVAGAGAAGVSLL